VVQEALANVAQHANATEVWVSLRSSGDELQLSVRDNGRGFDTGGGGARFGQTGFGLSGMAERVRQVAGRMDLRSNPGNGTEIDVRFALRASCSG
jgi:signal transduction histidine kinase